MKYAALLLISASVVLGAAVEEQIPQEVREQVHALETSPELTRIIKKSNSVLRGRSFFETMGDRVMSYFGYGSEDEYGDYAVDRDYYYPSLDGNMLGNGGSSYSIYNPYGSAHPARDDNFEEEEEYGWGDFMFDAGLVILPMALILGAMPTGMLTLPFTGRTLNNEIEQSLRPFELPVLKAIEKADFLSYTTRDCQERMFCEIAQVGRQQESSLLQKMFYLIANLTPEYYSKDYGMDRVFKAARDGACEIYKCVPLMTPSGIFGKKQFKIPAKETNETS